MKTIWKFEIPIKNQFVLNLPIGADILCVQVQDEAPRIWAIVSESAELEQRAFAVRGTGQPLGDVDKYIGSFQLHGGALVFHLFEAT